MKLIRQKGGINTYELSKGVFFEADHGLVIYEDGGGDGKNGEDTVSDWCGENICEKYH